jgi:lysophospholipase L1-like esterase
MLNYCIYCICHTGTVLLRFLGGLAAIAAVVGASIMLWPSKSAAGHVASCEHRPLEVAIVGASFTAGVGPGKPGESWAGLLTRDLHAEAVVYGVPGAGYVRRGAGHRGPVIAELEHIDLAAVDPQLVIVQAGHNDIGVPLALEKQRVTRAIDLIRAEAPDAKIALVTVFTRKSPSRAAYRTDRAIVSAATAADRKVIIMDPLTQGWRFGRVRDGLHPSAAGSQWLASTVERALHMGDATTAPDNCAPASPHGRPRSA